MESLDALEPADVATRLVQALIDLDNLEGGGVDVVNLDPWDETDPIVQIVLVIPLPAIGPFALAASRAFGSRVDEPAGWRAERGA